MNKPNAKAGPRSLIMFPTGGNETSSEVLFENSVQWLTTSEAATYLGVSPNALFNMTSNGKIPFYKLGRRNRYLVSELRKMLLQEPRGERHGN